ncbi:MAG: hypothetical protein ACPHL6_00855, partial [Rubripirellula sp.]
MTLDDLPFCPRALTPSICCEVPLFAHHTRQSKLDLYAFTMPDSSFQRLAPTRFEIANLLHQWLPINL